VQPLRVAAFPVGEWMLVRAPASHPEECWTSEGSGQQLTPTGRQDAINGYERASH
jgi:hypothetical protein